MSQAKLQQIREDFKENNQQEFIGFWGNKNVTQEEATFSNFYEADFVYDTNLDTPLRSVNPITFTSTEQFFMYKKAIHFDDRGIVSKIIRGGLKPFDYKKLGRKVSGYDDAEWDNVRYDYMKEALRLKYGQNDDLQKILLNTKNAILVEASPFDRIWGTGIGKQHKNGQANPDWNNPLKWQGLNLLGFALMDIREELK